VSATKTKSGKSAKRTPWLVYRLGGARAAYLGTVMAPADREAAIEVACDEFGITKPADRKRIVVQSTGSR
jgi:hypothetical protein